MILVTLTVRNPLAPNAAPRVENIPFASEWACKIMCERYMTCVDVIDVIAVSDLTGEVIFDSNDR